MKALPNDAALTQLSAERSRYLNNCKHGVLGLHLLPLRSGTHLRTTEREIAKALMQKRYPSFVVTVRSQSPLDAAIFAVVASERYCEPSFRLAASALRLRLVAASSMLKWPAAVTGGSQQTFLWLVIFRAFERCAARVLARKGS